MVQRQIFEADPHIFHLGPGWVVEIDLDAHPPSTDCETSYWGSLAPTLWHAGLIWREYEMVAFDLTPVELRIWCTFTDRQAFQSWRHHKLVVERCPEVLASRIDVVETVTPWSRHDNRCNCDESSSLVLIGHGFGNRKAVLFCCDCLGYYPNYREMYQNFRDLAVSGSEAEVRSLSLLDRFQVLLIRHRVDPKLLRGMDGRRLFEHGVEDGWIGKKVHRRLGLEGIAASGFHATVRIKLDNESTFEVFHFIKENEEWKIDLVPTYELAGVLIERKAKAERLRENDISFPSSHRGVAVRSPMRFGSRWTE